MPECGSVHAGTAAHIPSIEISGCLLRALCFFSLVPDCSDSARRAVHAGTVHMNLQLSRA
eukprot:1141580-Pelagomonas_calceolata.AAC.5